MSNAARKLNQAAVSEPSAISPRVTSQLRLHATDAAPPPAAVPAQALLAARGLHKSYRKGQLRIPVLRGVDFHIEKGQFVAIVGQSGCGKSTLMHLLGTLDHPDQGEVWLDHSRIDNLPARRRDQLRNRDFGMIFQFYHLLPELTTIENVLLPVMIGKNIWNYFRQRRELRQRAVDLLQMVGLGHRLRHRPRELSGGEMQRVAIARALLPGPRVLLADEPTGNLDEKTSAEVMEILRSLNEKQQLTIVMVTHDAGIAREAHRVVRLTEGRVAE